MVSWLYQFLVVPRYFGIPVESIWKQNWPDLSDEFDWHGVWCNITEVSHNRDHQQFYDDFIYKKYLTHENNEQSFLHPLPNTSSRCLPSYDLRFLSCLSYQIASAYIEMANLFAIPGPYLWASKTENTNITNFQLKLHTILWNKYF